jgi:hypothetical protein
MCPLQFTKAGSAAMVLLQGPSATSHAALNGHIGAVF